MGTETYSVFAHEPYEGQSVVFQGDREAVKAWIKAPNRGYHLGDLEIYADAGLDPFALYNEA